jgi:hypothetical protein
VFAIAAAITTLNPWSAIALTVLGFVLLGMWHKVCSNRAADVSFVQWMLIQAEEGADIPTPLANFKGFQAGQVITVAGRSVWRQVKKTHKGEVIDKPFVSMTQSPTRNWMEVYLPVLFVALWLAIFALAVMALCAARAA